MPVVPPQHFEVQLSDDVHVCPMPQFGWQAAVHDIHAGMHFCPAGQFTLSHQSTSQRVPE
jgi:hypothetical protein